MIESQELELLCSEDVRQAIERNIERDAADIALDKRVEHSQIVATQVKRLQRARTKLPSYYAVRALLPPLAYEQSSSEECALRKSLSGESVLDLTCGLGVDSYALSQHFKRVVSVERSEMVAAVARRNFALLGVENIEVVVSSAEEYVASCKEHFDWCFVDPDRRGEKGEKLVCLEACSPDMVSLLPSVRRIADNVCIKCSPLFDVDEAFRLFGACRVECVSLHGEAKEVNIYIGGDEERLSAVAIGVGSFECSRAERDAAAWSELPIDLSQYRYVILADVALQHARMVAVAMQGKADVWSNGGVALSRDLSEGVIGRKFEIEEIHSVDKSFRRVVQGRRINIYRRNFPLSNTEICRRYRCTEGGTEQWCFTRIGERLVAIKMKMICE